MFQRQSRSYPETVNIIDLKIVFGTNHMLHMSSGYVLLILDSKGQGHGILMFENCFWAIT